MRLRQLIAFVALCLGAPACTADDVELDTRPCGQQAPDRCSYNGGCRRFCTEKTACLCVSIEKAACDQTCTSGCVDMANMPVDDAYVPERRACSAAIDQSLRERAAAE